MELLKLLSANELVAQVISFLLLLILLRYFVWSKVLKVLDDRKARVAEELRKIEELKRQAQFHEKELSGKLHDIDKTAQERIQEALVEAHELARQVKVQADRDAHQIIESGREQIRHELGKAVQRVKNEIVDLTISASEIVVKEKLADDKDKKLVTDFLERLEKIT